MLLERGVRVVGTDGWSWDVPLPFEGEEFEKNHDASIIWEAHRVGRDKAYCHIEKLTNLDQLPVTGFKVSCFPVSIKPPPPAGPVWWPSWSNPFVVSV